MNMEVNQMMNDREQDATDVAMTNELAHQIRAYHGPLTPEAMTRIEHKIIQEFSRERLA